MAAGEVRGESAQSALIAQRLGERLGLTETVEHPLQLAEHLVHSLKVELQIDPQRRLVVSLREMLGDLDRPVEERKRLPGGAPLHYLGPSLAEIDNGFVPQLALNRVVREPFHVLQQALGIEALDGGKGCGVERASAIVQQAAVGDVVSEGVLAALRSQR